MREQVKAAITAYEDVYGDYAEDIQSGGNPALVSIETVALDAACEVLTEGMNELLDRILAEIDEHMKEVAASGARPSLIDDVHLLMMGQRNGIELVRQALQIKEVATCL
jgi:hypothetical protein